jgi:hypothetical protein
MYRIIFLLAAIALFTQCKSDDKKEKDRKETEKEDKDKDKESDKKETKTDYDMSTVDVKDRAEFKKNLEKIEKKHGDQWDFCTCVVKNDSINKAFSKPVGDKEFDRLSDRLDVIDKHCKAFLAQNPNQTPEERVKHEKQVKKCLKEAGVQ